MATTTTFKNRKTPGVFVSEQDAFPPSIVGVETAVPAFIGYTETAALNGKSVHLKPVRIGSMADYEAIFGRAPGILFDLTKKGAEKTNFDFEIPSTTPDTAPAFYLIRENAKSPDFNLYGSLRLFYANGGGDCYVVSVNTYANEKGTVNPIVLSDLLAGLTAVEDQPGPTLLVAPDGVNLGSLEDYGTLATGMLQQSARKQDRMAILDVYGGRTTTTKNLTQSIIAPFRGVVNEDLNCGAAYFPFLNTSIVQSSEIELSNFTTTELKTALDLYADWKYQGKGNEEELEAVRAEIALIGDGDTDQTTLNNDLLMALSPLLGQIYSVTANIMGLLPPSGAMAGIYAKNDRTRGVQNAPANYSLNAVISPTVNLNNEQQENLNLPLNGKAIDAIREFVGRGSVVWGARTLDGNSNDWRYIQVRRTIIYIDQSIKQALDPFVFAANDGKTWVTVVSMISNFLQGFWSQGGLMGATASEAFSVECGLGSTMTPQDILEGYMVVQVTLQMIRPAEFIELTFKQKMMEG